MILVTGAAKNLGREIALELARRKHSLVLHYNRSKKEAEIVAKECESLGVEVALLQGDFSTIEGVIDFCNRYTFETNGLVNNIGNYLPGPLSKTSETTWNDLFQTNLHTPFFLIKALLPQLKKNKGRVVNIGTSGVKSLRSNTYASAYTLTKGALAGLTLSFAKELAPDGITVNMISPGHLEVSIDKIDPESLPMKRVASFKEVAYFVGVLFEKEASYITGQNIEIAGGVAL